MLPEIPLERATSVGPGEARTGSRSPLGLGATAATGPDREDAGSAHERRRRGRRPSAAAAIALLLTGPTVIAFFSGGYFASPRQWAGLFAWALVAVAMCLVPRPLPRHRASLTAVGGLALFAGWTLLSTVWSPVAGLAVGAGQLVMLYLGVLVASVALLRDRATQRCVEPVLAGGALVVIAYGLSERLLPGLLHFRASVGAEGRLEQPLTYWNAMGELAAIGVVLAARIAGDWTRGRSVRLIAAVAVVPLGTGLYLSFSRGALFACSAGLVALVVAAPTRAQLRAVLVAIGAVVLGALATGFFSGVRSLSGALGARELDGALALVLLVVVAGLAGVLHTRWTQRANRETLRLPRRAPALAVALVLVGLAVAIISGAKESSREQLGSGASRLVTLQSDRYAYWRVALNAFGEQPVRGTGAGGWSVAWLRLRSIRVGAQDAHSLPLQTMAELGMVGLLLLLAFFGGIALAARRGRLVSPSLAAGPIAGFVAYAAHSPLDWDWQMPAVTLGAIILAGALIALSETAPADGTALPDV